MMNDNYNFLSFEAFNYSFKWYRENSLLVVYDKLAFNDGRYFLAPHYSINEFQDIMAQILLIKHSPYISEKRKLETITIMVDTFVEMYGAKWREGKYVRPV